MSNIYFTSDLHFGHRLVAKIRGFGDDDEATARHDGAICDNWRSTVTDRDVVYVLGDLCISDLANALGLLDMLPGKKHLIWGNHDAGHPMHKNWRSQQGRFLDVFATANVHATVKLGQQKLMLSHFPYDGDTDGRDHDRHEEWRLRDAGIPLIHGHVHSSTQFTASSIGTPQVHVGVDAWGLKPVDLRRVQDLLPWGAS